MTVDLMNFSIHMLILMNPITFEAGSILLDKSTVSVRDSILKQSLEDILISKPNFITFLSCNSRKTLYDILVGVKLSLNQRISYSNFSIFSIFVWKFNILERVIQYQVNSHDFKTAPWFKCLAHLINFWNWLEKSVQFIF